jgi:hypothetical protein
VKYKYQLVSYVVIFIVGYSSNFLLPVNFFVGVTSRAERAEHEDNESNKYVQIDKNSYINITSDEKKFVETKPKSTPPEIINRLVAASESKSSDGLEDLAALHSELAMLRDYRMQTEINKHSEYLLARGGNSSEFLNDSFKHEPVDAGWAKDKEGLINNLVDQSEHLSQVPHMASECRSKQCKLSVLSDDQFYLNKLSAALDKVIADHGSSFSSYSTVIDEKSHTTSIYFDRN